MGMTAPERPPGATRVALFIDHDVLRQSVRAALQAVPELEVVGGDDDRHRLHSGAPSPEAEVIVLDGSVPGPSGAASVRALRRDFPRARLVLLSVHEDAAHVWRALEEGAVGYVLADWAGKDLAVAVEAVRHDRVFVSPRLRWTVAKALRVGQAGQQNHRDGPA